MNIPNISQEEINAQLNKGTAFQKLVWNQLLKIPIGETKTYADIANQIGKPKGVRAVASAIAANTLFYQIPCHRVIKSNGDTGKYRWGNELKKELLKYELTKRA